jgi:hypothetical protein
LREMLELNRASLQSEVSNDSEGFGFKIVVEMGRDL